MIKEKGSLQPGKMFVVDMEQGRIISDDELKQTICSQKPYGEWLNKYKIRLEELPEPRVMFTHLSTTRFSNTRKHLGIQQKILKPSLRRWRWMEKNLLVPWELIFRWLY